MKKILIINPLFPDCLIPDTQRILSDWETTLFPLAGGKPLNPNFFHRGINIIKRVLWKDKTHFTQLNERNRAKQLTHSLQNLKERNYDIVLIFRPDRFPEKFIKAIRLITKQFVAYQCDGMTVCTGILTLRKYFDRLYTFEPEDIMRFPELQFLPATNFYFDRPDNATHASDTDFYYLGVGLQERQNVLNFLTAELKNYKTNFIVTSEKNEIKNGIQFRNTPLSYSENLKNVLETRVLVDLKLPYHNGLSFRFFEALGYRKKIITNNQSVTKYDFYHPDNIFITDFTDLIGLDHFLEKPMIPIMPEIMKKYSFINWIHYILDLDPHIKINLPQ